MNKPFCLQGTRILMRRLFKYDIDKIMECFKDYNKLIYSPIDADFINSIFYDGELWGAFVNDKIIACSYLYPLDSDMSQKTKWFSQLTDFISDPSQYIVLGYTGFNHDNIKQAIPCEKQQAVYRNLYKAFLNTAEMQTFRRGKKYVVHCTPLKLSPDLSPAFECGYELVKLRGLEKLVVHYIFVKTLYSICGERLQQKGESLRVAQSNTKALSRFLENNYCAFDVIKDGSENVLLLKNQ